MKACLFLIVIAILFGLPLVALAQSETGDDLVNTVNELRASQGLAPYQIDPWLMAYAQEHADYMASIQSGTHIHSDGSLPQDIGLIENVAGGSNGLMTTAIVVYEIWVDWGHRHTLVDFQSGEIGAGLALAENDQIYYALVVRPGTANTSVGEESRTPIPSPSTPGTSAPLASLVTSTPGADGSIIHTVNYGETLWIIAHSYSITVDEIRQLNGIPVDSTTIRVGDKLLIRPGSAETTILPDEISIPTSTTSEIPTIPPTLFETNKLSTKTMEPTITKTPTPIFTITIPSPSTTTTLPPSPTDLLLQNKRFGAITLFIIGIIGLFTVVIFGFIKPGNGK